MSVQPAIRRPPSRLRWISKAASISAMVIGGLVLVGWWFDSVLLTSLSTGVPMKANTAFAFVLAGLALRLLQKDSISGWSRGIAQTAAAIIALMGLLTLGEHLLAWNLGIDQLLVKDLQALAGLPHAAGRMAFMSAWNFLLLGSALLLLDVKTRGGPSACAEHVAVAVSSTAFLTLVAYLYGGQTVHQAFPFATVAPHAALLFLALSIGVVFARAQHRIVSIVISDTAAAVAMRRLLVVAILLPILAGWIRLKAQQSGFFGTEFGLAVMVLFAIITLTASIYWQATSLIQAEEYQRGINEMSGVLSRSLHLEEIYPAYADALKAILPYHRICVVVREGEKLVAALSVAESPLQSYQGKTWLSSGKTAVEWVMTHKIPRLVRDLSQEQTFADEVFVAREGVRATLMLPLVAGGETVGVFVVDSRTPGTYSEGHESLVGLITEQLALAIQNANLYAQVKRHAQELERLVEERTRELQTANGHLAEASRHKSNFLANMSHELRTPLNAILGFADLLCDQAVGPMTPKQARYTNHIQTSGRHLLTLINDLLDLSKVEAGKLTLHLETFVLSEALTIAIDDIRPVADVKRLTIVSDIDTVPITLTADPVRFKQIVFNLLSNGIKFTPEGGHVTVTAHQFSGSGPQPPTLNPQPLDGDFVEIAVIDTGIGIAAEDLPCLFERFRQLETAKQSQGSGLGLALTKQLVELHGGTIAVTSAGPGHGSTFTVRLPLTPDAGRGMGEEQ